MRRSQESGDQYAGAGSPISDLVVVRVDRNLGLEAGQAVTWFRSSPREPLEVWRSRLSTTREMLRRHQELKRIALTQMDGLDGSDYTDHRTIADTRQRVHPS